MLIFVHCNFISSHINQDHWSLVKQLVLYFLEKLLVIVIYVSATCCSL